MIAYAHNIIFGFWNKPQWAFGVSILKKSE
jgi:hypothetical protein